MNKRFLRLAIPLVLFALVIASGVAVQAQTTADEIEIVGTVQAINGSVVTVNKLQINIGQAEFNAVVKVGSTIKVEGTVDATGKINARQVNPWQDTATVPEVELVGQIDTVNGTQITVSGQTFDIANAEVQTQVAVGQVVVLHVTFNADGTAIVREVNDLADDQADATQQPTDDGTASATQAATAAPTQAATDDGTPEADDNQNGDEVELTGIVEEVGDGFIVIGGQRIDTSKAEVKGVIAPGVVVKVHLINGQLVAREVGHGRLRRRNDDNNGAVATDDHRGSGKGGDDNVGDDNSGSGKGGSDDNSGSGSSGGSDDNSGSGGSGGGNGGMGSDD